MIQQIRDLYKKIQQAGVRYIAFGIESSNQEILDSYNKKITLNQTIKAVRLAKEMKFSIIGNFILGAPNESYKQIQQTIKFSKSLLLDKALFYPLIYWHDSLLWHEAVKKDKIDEREGYCFAADKKRGLGNFA